MLMEMDDMTLAYSGKFALWHPIINQTPQCELWCRLPDGDSYEKNEVYGASMSFLRNKTAFSAVSKRNNRSLTLISKH